MFIFSTGESEKANTAATLALPSRIPRLAAMFMALALALGPFADAAELVTLSPQNYEAYVPRAKEIDAIWGDYVLRNDRITAIVADPGLHMGRSASRNVSPVPTGGIIDLFRHDHPVEVLHVFLPLGRVPNSPLNFDGIPHEPNSMREYTDPKDTWRKPERAPQRAARVMLRLPFQKNSGEVRYILEDGWDHVLVEVSLRASKTSPLVAPYQALVQFLDPGPRMGADVNDFIHSFSEDSRLAWFYDPQFGMAYGAWSDAPTRNTLHPSGNRTGINRQLAVTEGRELRVAAGETFVWSTAVWPARDGFVSRRIGARFTGELLREVPLTVVDGDGPAANVLVTARTGRILWGAGRSNAQGQLVLALPADRHASIQVLPEGRSASTFQSAAGETAAVRHRIPKPTIIRGEVRDQGGNRIPAKLAFTGLGGTPDPDFGPVTASFGVANLRYTHDGAFHQILPPGRYRVRATRGPEYEHFQADIEIADGAVHDLQVTLPRVVNTPGWVSADLSNRTTVSRPYSSASVEGRLLNLLGEHIEFAPATEANQVYDYAPHIRALGAERMLASSPGVGLTQRVRKAWNAQNSFPARYVRGAHDGGAIQRSAHVGQVFWLNGWYSELNRFGGLSWESDFPKLIQVTPPGIWPQDGRSDGMYALFYPHITAHENANHDGRMAELRSYHAMEIQPLGVFGDLPDWTPEDPAGEADQQAWWRELEERQRNNWPEVRNRQKDYFRMLRAGYRITGVVNNSDLTNRNGSSRWRTWVRNPAATPADIQALDIVRAVQLGQTIMSSGPFLELTAFAGANQAGPGDDLLAPDGNVRLRIVVQAPSRMVIDRVMLIVNGLRHPAHDYLRDRNPDLFSGTVRQFEIDIDLVVPVDSFITVFARGTERIDEKNSQGHQAMAMPIYIAMDGNGFKPHNPVDDKVFALLDPLGQLARGPDAAPSRLRLYLYNNGRETATDSVQIQVFQKDAAVLSEDGRWTYTVAPGELIHKDFLVRVNPESRVNQIQFHIPRSSEGIGRRAVGLTWSVNGRYTNWTDLSRGQHLRFPWHPETLRDVRPRDWDTSPRVRALRTR